MVVMMMMMMMFMKGRWWRENDDVDVEEEEDDEVEEDDVEEEDRSQDREAHFVRAWAGDMHTDISQEPFVSKSTGITTADTSRDIILCEPAQCAVEESEIVWAWPALSKQSQFW